MTGLSAPTLEERVAQAEAIEAVSRLKARYFRLMDQKMWDDWEELFAPNAVMDMRGEVAAMKQLGMNVGDAEGWVLQSRASIRAAVELALEGVTTVHHGHMPEFAVQSPNEICATWAMTDVIRYPPGRPVAGFHGFGHYHDTYVLTEQGWSIREIVLKRLTVKAI